MNAITERIFRYKKINFAKLEGYGFTKTDGKFVYKTPIIQGQMRLTVRIDGQGDITTEVLDLDTEEPYTLFLAPEAVGEFVGSVRCAYENALEDIAEKCAERQVFKSTVTHALFDYAYQKYGDSPEYLWEKFPDCAIIRRKDNAKWYCAVLTVKACKIGLEGEQVMEVVDLRADPDELAKLIDNRKYFAGYHMNKKHWLTIPLDGTVSIEEICSRLDQSYILAKK
ncbi:MAG: MmcQ/YjbR family DNA-binding protein [Clostridia bacterium]|nr:MmcQ/YjbR family DNA-binding protein [Clostridia bacterium]